MPRTSFDALQRALQEGRRGGVFFLHGEESYLREEAERCLVEAHLDPATRDFNLDLLRGSDLDAEAFASVVHTPPMMAEWRVVVMREAQALSGSAKLRSTVEELLARPPAGLALILSAELPARSKAKFWDRLSRDATSVAFPALDASDVPGWLMEWAADRDIRLGPDAASLLVSAVGTDLGVLLQEVRKLRDFVGDDRSIDAAAVSDAVGALRSQDRWAWFDQVGSGDIARARSTLPVLLSGSETGVGLVIGLGSQFLRLALAARGGERVLSEALPHHQKWLARRLVSQARHWTAEALDGVLDDLLRADRLLKSTSLDDLQILDELLLRLEGRRLGALA